ncbi:hypothetical protein CITRIK5_30127 [Citricoccus sp. K5]|nr:hypothetical protein CITRIK5_30127 [Citricoccus sp. K5]
MSGRQRRTVPDSGGNGSRRTGGLSNTQFTGQTENDGGAAPSIYPTRRCPLGPNDTLTRGGRYPPP